MCLMLTVSFLGFTVERGQMKADLVNVKAVVD